MMNSNGVMPSASPPSSPSSFGHQSLLNPSVLSSAYRPPQLPHPRISLSSSSWSASSRPRLPRLCCSGFPGSPGSGESDSRTVLDAFFLGKALGEALTERIESTVGEVLSTIGRLQAEQQKQVQEFQEDVLERAKRSKEQAAREALQDVGRLIPSSTTADAPVTNGAISSEAPGSSGLGSLAASTSVDNQNSSPSSVDENRTDQDRISSIPVDE